MGEKISNPSTKQLRNTLKELFASNDEEHPDAWIECGSDDGPLYILSVYSGGYAIYTKYSDVNMTEELENKKIENLDVGSTLELWQKLIAGELI
jgi:hypothetical protein